ncbi:hypothetical protein L7F22_039592 [Adiantum nelumboides]|nr:hypothetical protein [Adiantum nelumboides]
MGSDELEDLFHARACRRFQRGQKRKPMALIKKLCKAKRAAPAGEKPDHVRTHLRSMIIVPEMICSIIGVYNGNWEDLQSSGNQAKNAKRSFRQIPIHCEL